ncbi:MAG: cupin domain-containing protein [Bacillota bacterium]
MNIDAEILIGKLELLPHPEGGFFKETYRSEGFIDQRSLPKGFNGKRNYSTGIYFLLKGTQMSRFHRIRSDEMWHHYYGCAVNIHMIDNSGTYSVITLGKDILNGEVPQAVVPAGAWFGAELADKDSFALSGCTVSPGFDFLDFELAQREVLLSMYPELREIIQKLT